MMGGNFGSAAAAFLLIPVLLVVLGIGAVLGFGVYAVFDWLF